MATNDKPAILPTDELESMRRELENFSTRPYRHKQIADALLGHIDALIRGDVDKEALGREAFRSYPSVCGRLEWENLTPTERAWAERIGSVLYTLGRAAGRSEGEAERAQLEAQIVNNEAVARESIEAAYEEIARLTAELAAERQKHGEDLLATMRSHDAALVAARAEGARVEREACAQEAERPLIEFSEIDVLDKMPEKNRIARRIRARGEGGPT